LPTGKKLLDLMISPGVVLIKGNITRRGGSLMRRHIRPSVVIAAATVMSVWLGSGKLWGP